MKFVLAALSDIHFTGDSTNPIPRRLDQICSAIASAEVMPDTIVLLFSGDIANKGKELEYQVADHIVMQRSPMMQAPER
jgi:hypothetical protein